MDAYSDDDHLNASSLPLFHTPPPLEHDMYAPDRSSMPPLNMNMAQHFGAQAMQTAPRPMQNHPQAHAPRQEGNTYQEMEKRVREHRFLPVLISSLLASRSPYPVIVLDKFQPLPETDDKQLLQRCVERVKELERINSPVSKLLLSKLAEIHEHFDTENDTISRACNAHCNRVQLLMSKVALIRPVFKTELRLKVKQIMRSFIALQSVLRQQCIAELRHWLAATQPKPTRFGLQVPPPHSQPTMSGPVASAMMYTQNRSASPHIDMLSHTNRPVMAHPSPATGGFSYPSTPQATAMLPAEALRGAPMMANDTELTEADFTLTDDTSGSGRSRNRKRALKGKRGSLPRPAIIKLRTWLFEHFEHPYPTEQQKAELAEKTSLTYLQVNNWFINARVRIWRPMVENAQLDKDALERSMPTDMLEMEEGEAPLMDDADFDSE
eukprot:GILK01007026.1.p1 GENE.GILK01007026.1~~GILK01007026.1.p1  ORF type:complete len:451 (+),score=52.57 GILK01007026.1:42-1355(+)